MRKQGPGLLHDFIFKIVFACPRGEPILRSFLNTILSPPAGKEIVRLDMASPSLEKETLDDKGPVLDLRVRDEKGGHYNIEIQVREPVGDDYLKRSIYYGARIYSQQLETGRSYSELKRTICISVLGFNLEALVGKPMCNRFLLREPDRGFDLCNDLEFHYIELRKLDLRKLWEQAHEQWTKLEKWLYALKTSHKYHTIGLPAILAEEEDIVMAIDAMREAYARDEVRELIFSREKTERDRQSRERAAELLKLKLEQTQLELERAEREKEEAQREIDEIHREIDEIHREREEAHREREEAQREREKVHREKEEAQKKAERFRQKLLEAGIDPDA